MKNAVIAVVSVVAALAIVAGGTVELWNGTGDADEGASGVAEGSSEIAPLAQIATAPVSEGLIYAGEYRNNLHDVDTGMTLFWQNDASILYVGLISPGTGWIAAGFSNRTGKPGSNIIIGAVADGTVTIQDNYGLTRVLHLPDKLSSVLAFGGSEIAGETTLEFVIPLASGDAQDTTLSPGQMIQVILAYQATSDGFTAEHTRYSMTSILLDP